MFGGARIRVNWEVSRSLVFWSSGHIRPARPTRSPPLSARRFAPGCAAPRADGPKGGRRSAGRNPASCKRARGEAAAGRAAAQEEGGGGGPRYARALGPRVPAHWAGYDYPVSGQSPRDPTDCRRSHTAVRKAPDPSPKTLVTEGRICATAPWDPQERPPSQSAASRATREGAEAGPCCGRRGSRTNSHTNHVGEPKPKTQAQRRGSKLAKGECGPRRGPRKGDRRAPASRGSPEAP